MLVSLVLAGALVVGLGACGSSSSKGAKQPVTHARLIVVAPEPNAVVGTSVHLVFKIIGGRVVGPSVTTLSGDEGHIHVSVDGRIVSMLYGTTQTVSGLTPGLHTLSAEFVAANHIPFANPQNVLQRFVITVKK
jgi:hypothetical protein